MTGSDHGARVRVLVVSHPSVLQVNQLVYAELAGRGWQVTLVVPAHWRHEYSAERVRPEPLPPLAGSFHSLPVALAGRPQRHCYLVNPIRVLRTARPDVVFLEQESFSVAALQWAIAAYILRIPFGVQAAETLNRPLPGPVRAARAWVLRHAAFVAARSPAAGRLARQWGALGDVQLVPHHVPGWAVGTRSATDRFRIGFAGRLVPEKGLDVLVSAVCRLEGPRELVVAGDGPQRAWLEAQDLNGASLKILTGLDHAEMDAAYAQMDVLVLPSRSTPTWVEQFGRVLVEALWCGVAVVGSDSSEIRWVIEATGGGRVFPEGDAVALADTLGDLWDAGTRAKFAEEGSSRVRELFGVSAVASELDSVLRRATSTRPRPRAQVASEPRPLVALVAHEIHDFGGMERACAELIRGTQSDVRFVAVTANLAPELRPLVERWVRVPVPRRPIPLKFVAFFVLAGIALRRQRPDLVHTVGALIPNRADVAAVHFCHAGALQTLGSLVPSGAPLARQANTTVARSFGLLAERWCYRPGRIRLLAPVSGGVAAELATNYPKVPLEIVGNGVDIEHFKPDVDARREKRLAEGVNDQELVVLFVGGDWNHKGLAIAIEGVAAARTAGFPFLLWVVGSGDQRRFGRLAAGFGISERLRFFGQRPDTVRFYQAADIFVLPSKYETFSLVAHEAAACGLPIVATGVSGVAELIGADEAGIVAARDGGSVGAALCRLARSPDTRYRLGAEAQRRATACTWPASTAKMLEVYRSLLEPSLRDDAVA